VSSGQRKRGAVEYVSGAGLRLLLHAAKQLTNASGKITLHSLSEPVKQVFDITGVSLAFRIYGSREEAVALLSCRTRPTPNTVT
jgi:anti-anti-sigma factor